MTAFLILAACQQDAMVPPSASELVDRGVEHARSVHRVERKSSGPTLAKQAPDPVTCDRFCPPTGFPLPPSDEPKAYADWLAQQSKADQKRIAAFCKAHPDDYELVCGGIGTLRIPYPPGPRIFASQPGDPVSRFASQDLWEKSLTRTQHRYWVKECWHGESSPSNDLCGDNTPLVVAFDNQRVEFATGATFAFQTTPSATDWPTAATPWIALDRDGNGSITSGAELFGSDTILPSGAHATNGFEALAALDANHDGRIDAADPAFASLVLWSDRDGNGRSTPDELAPLSATITSISLDNRPEPHCDARENCEGERAALVWHDSSGPHAGSVVDVYLPRR